MKEYFFYTVANGLLALIISTIVTVSSIKNRSVSR